ncbi:hypothetical protein HK405_005810 [Cladochytrium tenue]|nr:hypothetical protein HK405_005810 [Cladochytrium tenue]
MKDGLLSSSVPRLHGGSVGAHASSTLASRLMQRLRRRGFVRWLRAHPRLLSLALLMLLAALQLVALALGVPLSHLLGLHRFVPFRLRPVPQVSPPSALSPPHQLAPAAAAVRDPAAAFFGGGGGGPRPLINVQQQIARLQGGGGGQQPAEAGDAGGGAAAEREAAPPPLGDMARGSSFARSIEQLKNEKAFIKRERVEWMGFLRRAPAYSPEDLGVVPGSRGVVLTGPSRSVPSIITAVMLLRETGCTLPVQFSYLRHEVTDEDLVTVASFNISAVDFSDAVRGNDWSKEDVRLGAAKVDSILASPFEQVLFLDPDNYVLRDPTFLFDTKMFQRYGALFWPDFPVRLNDSELVVWDIFNLKGKYWKELEFESGQIVLDKSRVWKALMLTRYISQQAKYYFSQFLGDKEAFFWGFAGTGTPYFLNPTYIHSVGAIVNDTLPLGDIQLDLNQPDSKFCGQSMLQSDFFDDPDVPPPLGYSPQPLFMHWNMLKYKYTEGVDYFQSAMTYELPADGTRFADYKAVGFRVHGDWGAFSHCLDLRHVIGLKIRVWPWGDLHPNKAVPFHLAYRAGQDAVETTRMRRFLRRLEGMSYATEQPHVGKGTRGIVFATSRKNVHNIIMATLLLRRTGCALPVAFLYNRGDTSGAELDILAKYNITAVDFHDSVSDKKWSHGDWSHGAAVAAALLKAPFEEILFLEPETYLLRDPTFLFSLPEFAKDGALFWQDVNRRQVEPHLLKMLGIWDDKIGAERESGMELKNGIMVLSKPKVWRALKYAEFMLSDSYYFFKHLNGYKETFYYAFRTSGTPFYLNPLFPELVGAVVSPLEPAGRAAVSSSGAEFCGQAIVLHSPPSQSETGGGGAPLLLDMRFLDTVYEPELDYFQTAAAVSWPGDDASPAGVGVTVTESAGRFQGCLAWDSAAVEAEGGRVQLRDWEAVQPRTNARFHQIRQLLPGQAEMQKLKRQRVLSALGPYLPTRLAAAAAKKHKASSERRPWWPFSWLFGPRRTAPELQVQDTEVAAAPAAKVDGDGDAAQAIPWQAGDPALQPPPKCFEPRGVVIPASMYNLASVVRTILLLRDSGCSLPITVTYYKGGLSEMQVEGLKTFKLNVLDLTPFVRTDTDWTDRDLSLAVKLQSIASAPYCEVLVLNVESDIFPLSDPTALFDHPVLHPPTPPRRNAAAVDKAAAAALFWPATQPRNQSSPLWEALDVREHRVPAPQLDAAHFVVDRQRAWPAVAMALHLVTEGRFYTTHIPTEAEALFWGLAATGVAFAVVPRAPEVVGIAVDATHPFGGAPPARAADELRRTPLGRLRAVRFCGLATAHVATGGARGDPLFLRLRFFPDVYEQDFGFLELATAWASGGDAAVAVGGADGDGDALEVERDVPFHPVCLGPNMAALREGSPAADAVRRQPLYVPDWIVRRGKAVSDKYWAVVQRVLRNTRKVH